MGEKGNVLGGAADAMVAAVPAESLIERVTTTTRESVVDVGQDLADTIREKAIGAVADESVAAARERVQRPGATAADEPTEGGARPGNAPPGDSPGPA